MIYEASAMTVRKTFGEILNSVQYQHNTVVIKKAEKAVAALVDIDLFEKIRTMKKEFDQLTMALGQSYNNESAVDLESDIKEAMQAIRGKKKSKKQKTAKDKNS